MDEHASASSSETPNYGATSTTSALSGPAQQAVAGPSDTGGANGAPSAGHPGEVAFREGRGIRGALQRWNPQMTLKNTGSVARDHLALERTWLAWTRTSLSIASTGVALVQLFALSAQMNSEQTSAVSSQIMRVAKPLGAVTIAFAFMVLVIGSWRYFRVQYALTQDYFPPARVSPVIMSGFMGCLVVAVFAVVVSLTNK